MKATLGGGGVQYPRASNGVNHASLLINALQYSGNSYFFEISCVSSEVRNVFRNITTTKVQRLKDTNFPGIHGRDPEQSSLQLA